MKLSRAPPGSNLNHLSAVKGSKLILPLAQFLTVR